MGTTTATKEPTMMTTSTRRKYTVTQYGTGARIAIADDGNLYRSNKTASGRWGKWFLVSIQPV